MKAIETRYKGYRFRSRLEARWAVFFDAARIAWQYETQGFVTSLGPYLPDFFLPEIGERGTWIEIKPHPSFDEDPEETNQKLCDVIGITNAEGIVVRGDPASAILPDIYDRPGVDTWQAWAIIQVGGEGPGLYDCPYLFCVCPWCGKVGLEYDGRGARVCNNHKDTYKPHDNFPYGNLHHGDKAYSHNHPDLIEAALISRSARFEHGETPRVSP